MSYEPKSDEPRLLATFFSYHLPVLVWMALILRVSGDAYASEHTASLLAPLLRRIIPPLSQEALAAIVFFVRKVAHLTEYAILAALLHRDLVRSTPRRRLPAAAARLAFALCLAFATLDEVRQAFSTVRTPSFSDILLDATGAALAILPLWLRARP